jgi:molybdenum cofactor cytidylyltransferase
MLTWQGVPLVRKVALTALEAGLNPVVVVIGAYGDQVQTAVQDLPVVVVYNSDWSEGQSTSVQIGLKALPERIGGAVFLLADQPCVSAGLLNALMEGHAQTFSPIVAPIIEGRRGNPVLFDRVTFPHLFSLHGDVGGRALFSHFPPWWVRWDDSRVLFDVDTPEDYQRLLDISID